jgi:hypothetical protein
MKAPWPHPYDSSYSDKEATRQAILYRHAQNTKALKRLRENENVRTPDGWVGTIVHKFPMKGEVYVESYEMAGTYEAAEVTRISKQGQSHVDLFGELE